MLVFHHRWPGQNRCPVQRPRTAPDDVIRREFGFVRCRRDSQSRPELGTGRDCRQRNAGHSRTERRVRPAERHQREYGCVGPRPRRAAAPRELATGAKYGVHAAVSSCGSGSRHEHLSVRRERFRSAVNISEQIIFEQGSRALCQRRLWLTRS